jgi:hypothetical protein
MQAIDGGLVYVQNQPRRQLMRATFLCVDAFRCEPLDFFQVVANLARRVDDTRKFSFRSVSLDRFRVDLEDFRGPLHGDLLSLRGDRFGHAVHCRIHLLRCEGAIRVKDAPDCR